MRPGSVPLRRRLREGAITTTVAGLGCWCAASCLLDGHVAEMAAASSLHAALLLALTLPLLRRQHVVGGIAVVGIAAGAMRWTVAGYEARAPAPSHAQATVAVANLYTLSAMHGQAIDAALANGPDLLCLLETARDDERDYGAIARLPHQIWDQSNVGIALLSALPLADGIVHREVMPPMIEARVRMDGDDVMVIACHLSSPVNESSFRAAEAARARIRGLLAAWRGPAMVLGDLNLAAGGTRWRSWRGATGLRRPTGLEPSTWPDLAGPLGIGIDHVLGRDLAIAPAHAFELPGSDHRGLVARISTLRSPADSVGR